MGPDPRKPYKDFLSADGVLVKPCFAGCLGHVSLDKLICTDNNDFFISSISEDLRDLRKDIFCLKELRIKTFYPLMALICADNNDFFIYFFDQRRSARSAERYLLS
jgi:hypothetical protein